MISHSNEKLLEKIVSCPEVFIKNEKYYYPPNETFIKSCEKVFTLVSKHFKINGKTIPEILETLYNELHSDKTEFAVYNVQEAMDFISSFENVFYSSKTIDLLEFCNTFKIDIDTKIAILDNEEFGFTFIIISNDYNDLYSKTIEFLRTHIALDEIDDTKITKELIKLSPITLTNKSDDFIHLLCYISDFELGKIPIEFKDNIYYCKVPSLCLDNINGITRNNNIVDTIMFNKSRHIVSIHYTLNESTVFNDIVLLHELAHNLLYCTSINLDSEDKNYKYLNSRRLKITTTNILPEILVDTFAITTYQKISKKSSKELVKIFYNNLVESRMEMKKLITELNIFKSYDFTVDYNFELVIREYVLKSFIERGIL